MKIWVGLMAAVGIAISAETAVAQGVYPRVASDFEAPYEVLSPGGLRPLPPRTYGPRYGERTYDERPYDGSGYAPAMLPPTAVYGILRERGFSPLGIPQQRGFVYTISVISPEGDDGRLVIDARSGRILRFLPAFRMGDRMNNEVTVSYGPVGAPPVMTLSRNPRPPASTPPVASRPPNVPLPKPMPARAAAPPASKPAEAQALLQQPVAPTPVPASPPAVIEAKPSTPSILPTQEMPAVRGFE